MLSSKQLLLSLSKKSHNELQRADLIWVGSQRLSPRCPPQSNFSSWQDYTSVSMTVGSDQETCSLVTVFCWLQ
jgi:hypothetical protein